MPEGSYAVFDGEGGRVGTEEFRCAPGPMGWRYVSTIETSLPSPHSETVDLAVDADWRPVRMHVETGEHSLLLQRADGRLVGHRDGDELELDFPDDRELDYLSPAFNAVTAMRYGRTVEFDVWYFEPVSIGPVAMRQRYERRGEDAVETPSGRFRAVRWGYEALGPGGFVSEFWVAGDVVVRYERLFELERYQPGATGAAPIG